MMPIAVFDTRQISNLFRIRILHSFNNSIYSSIFTIFWFLAGKPNKIEILFVFFVKDSDFFMLRCS